MNNAEARGGEFQHDGIGRGATRRRDDVDWRLGTSALARGEFLTDRSPVRGSFITFVMPDRIRGRRRRCHLRRARYRRDASPSVGRHAGGTRQWSTKAGARRQWFRSGQQSMVSWRSAPVRTRPLVRPARSSRARQWHTARCARARPVATIEAVVPRASQWRSQPTQLRRTATAQSRRRH